MQEVCLLFCKKRADKFRRILKARVVLVDDDLRQDARDLFLDAAVFQHVRQRLGNHISQTPLRLRAADIQRIFRHELFGNIILQHNAADLRAVAVGKDDLIARFEQIGNTLAARTDILLLLRNRAALVFLCNRVAADGNDNFPVHTPPPFFL